MPPRPSRNLDRALIAAGQALYPTTGCAGLTIRQVAEAAGVNIGMFHYHFKTREAFLRAVMQAHYEEMFSRLPAPPGAQGWSSPKDMLRHALMTLGGYVREHRAFLARLVCDVMAQDPIAREFFAANFPRHLDLVGKLIASAQEAGELRPLPVPQVIAFCAGAISLPVLAVGSMVDSGSLPTARKRALEAAVLSAAAVEQRVDLVLFALSNPEAPIARKKRK